MPSQTFLNLNKIKQNNLIDCAIREFSEHPLENVSINRIINEANISRGSFYMYFRDKEDLFEYLLENYRNKIENLMCKSFLEHHGDIRSSFITIYDCFINEFMDYKNFGFFKNTFIYMNSKTEKFIKPCDLPLKVLNLICTDTLKTIDLEVVFDLFMQNLFSTIVKTIREDINFDRDDYIKTLDVLCYGIYKEENDD